MACLPLMAPDRASAGPWLIISMFGSGMLPILQGCNREASQLVGRD